MKVHYRFRKAHLEAYIWLLALISFALATPVEEPHFTLCLFSFLGIDFCPGCGLGRAIIYLFHGDVMASWQSHPLAIFAVVILLLRTYRLLKDDLRIAKLKPKSYE
jgi:hypothetical protein